MLITHFCLYHCSLELLFSYLDAGDKTTASVDPTISSFSLDFNESPTPTPTPIQPSPMRSVRKRGKLINKSE